MRDFRYHVLRELDSLQAAVYRLRAAVCDAQGEEPIGPMCRAAAALPGVTSALVQHAEAIEESLKGVRGA